MIVTISNDGMGNLTVHHAGCRDLKRERFEARWDAIAQSQKDAVLATYDPGDFEYNPDTEWQNFNDLQFKPCVKSLRRGE